MLSYRLLSAKLVSNPTTRMRQRWEGDTVLDPHLRDYMHDLRLWVSGQAFT